MPIDKIISKTVKLSFSEFTVTLIPAGRDIQVLILGGESPHIGCSVLAVPRQSLSGSGKTSCTSSVINASGHKDEELVRRIAEKTCMNCGCVVSASGGFHVDNMTPGQIEEVCRAVNEFDVRV